MVVNNRIWIGLAVIVMIGIVALGWLLGVSPRLAEAAKNELDRQSVETLNDVRRAELARLKEENEQIGTHREELAALQRKLPPNNDLSTFLGELHQLELASGVVLTNFGSTDAVPFVLDNGVAPEGDTETVEQGLASEEFIVIEISLTVAGNQQQVLDFIDALQKGDRRYLVTGLSITTEEGIYTGTIVGYVYVLIDPSKPATGGTVEETPAG